MLVDFHICIFSIECIEKEAEHYLELLGSSEIIFSSEKKCILLTATERHKLLFFFNFFITKLILHGHKILKEGSSKVAIHSPSDDADILLLTLAHLYKCKERFYIINSHGQYKKHSNIFVEDEIIKSLIGFHAFTGNSYISSFYRTRKQCTII